MKQEEKDLLLADLSARLQYHVVLHFDDKVQQDDEYLYGFRENAGKYLINDAYYIEEVKPYLRPLSSMTDEERDILHGLASDMANDWFDAEDNLSKNIVGCEYNSKCVDFMNSRHLDHHGLIEKGLAMEATEGMYE